MARKSSLALENPSFASPTVEIQFASVLPATDPQMYAMLAGMPSAPPCPAGLDLVMLIVERSRHPDPLYLGGVHASYAV